MEGVYLEAVYGNLLRADRPFLRMEVERLGRTGNQFAFKRTT